LIYYKKNFVRYLINVCVDVKEFIAIVLKIAFKF